MGRIDLPIAHETATLPEAGALMAEHHVAAVVVQRGRDWLVLTADAMHQAVQSAGKHGHRRLTLADVEPPPHLAEAVRHRPSPPHRAAHARAFAPAFDDLRAGFDAEPRAQFVVLDHDGPLATVATAQETIEATLRTSLNRGVCRDDPTHKWWSFELIVPGRCNDDDAIVDFP